MLKKAEVLAGEQTSVPVSSARSGGCGDQMIIKQYMKCNIAVGIKPFHIYVAKVRKQKELLTA